jgi:uncharacterized protein YndB with AHSA1/START domain
MLCGWQQSEEEITVKPDRHGSAVVEFPTELEIVIKRSFDAPIALVFEVLTTPEHARRWGATHPDTMLECSIDLRVGGSYHSVFETGDGTRMAIGGTYLEVEPPHRTVETWRFEGFPEMDAVETMELNETDGVTTFTWRLLFDNKAGRDRMTSVEGQQESLDEIAEILAELQSS